MPQAAPADHRHEAAAGCDDGCQHQADLVADAARRVLVDDRSVDVDPRPVEHLARVQHGPCQCDTFLARHALEQHGHRQGRHLALAPAALAAGAQALGEGLDLRRIKRAAIALDANDFGRRQHNRFS